MLNKVILMGRLTRDPEQKSTQSGISVTTFTLAVDRGYAKAGEERQADFINIVAFRASADFVARYFTKGQLVAVCGRLQTRNWDDNEGKKRWSTDVVVEEQYFAESKASFESHRDSAPAAVTNNTSTQTNSSDGFYPVDESIEDEDLPF